MITTRLKQEIILCSQSTPLPASIRGQRPWNWVKVFLTVKENLGILQYLFTSNLYQYLIYLLIIIKKHWKLKKPPTTFFVFIRKPTHRECFLGSSLSCHTSYRNVGGGIFPGNAVDTHLPFVLDDKPTVRSRSGTRLRNGNLIQCQYWENTIS